MLITNALDMIEKDKHEAGAHSDAGLEVGGLLLDTHEVDAFADMMRDESGLTRISRKGLLRGLLVGVRALRDGGNLPNSKEAVRRLVWAQANEYVQQRRTEDPRWEWEVD
jgi:hypothetical protein